MARHSNRAEGELVNRPRAGGRRGSDWVAEARADEGSGKCVVCGKPLPPRHTVLCGHLECRRTYETLSRAEARDKARSVRLALNAPPKETP